MKGKRSKATDISLKVRNEVKVRDEGCIFCRMGYSIVEPTWIEIMHFIPRSQGGMGVPENLACGCAAHHRMLDASEHRKDMLQLFEWYLKDQYEEWSVEYVVYRKQR